MKDLVKNGEINIVFDGGALLYRVDWSKNATFGSILSSYKAYIRNIIGKVEAEQTSVVFDGYLESSTKDHCHFKRCPIKSPDQCGDLERKLLCKKSIFLSNSKNKDNFIKLLARDLTESGFQVHQTNKDADVEIITNAITALGERDTLVIGDDTDLLVLAVHYMKEWGMSNNKLIMYRPSSHSYIDIGKVVSAHPDHVTSNILAIHALSGCDTVSSLAGIGKTKLVKAIAKDEDLAEELSTFSTPQFDDKTIEAGMANLS